VLDSGKAAGAREASYVLLRLPLEVSPLFRDWLLQHYPDRYRHVMSLVRSMRDGKDYDAEFGKRMKGAGPYAWQIARRFEMDLWPVLSWLLPWCSISTTSQTVWTIPSVSRL
jgi:DNA repair photolyase